MLPFFVQRILFHFNTHIVLMMKIYDGLLMTMINISFSDRIALLLEKLIFDILNCINFVISFCVALGRLLMEHTLTRSVHLLGMCQSEGAF
jgi:hypothetical protein